MTQHIDFKKLLTEFAFFIIIGIFLLINLTVFVNNFFVNSEVVRLNKEERWEKQKELKSVMDILTFNVPENVKKEQRRRQFGPNNLNYTYKNISEKSFNIVKSNVESLNLINSKPFNEVSSDSVVLGYCYEQKDIFLVKRDDKLIIQVNWNPGSYCYKSGKG